MSLCYNNKTKKKQQKKKTQNPKPKKQKNKKMHEKQYAMLDVYLYIRDRCHKNKTKKSLS